MSHHLLDVRIWGPLALAIAAVCWRGAPQRPQPPATTARAVALPTVRAAPEPHGDVDYVLDPERSSVRFLVDGTGGDHLAVCAHVSGRLRIRDGDDRRELELALDLGSLQPVDDAAPPLDLWQLLGVHRSSQVLYRAHQIRSADSGLPGVTQRLWLGTLRFDGSVVQQPMELWQTLLRGQPLRLQGHGPVAADTYGLPTRGWFGLTHPSHVVILGLDLAFRRDRGR